MKILILTQYYPPETGAPQNRLQSLAFYFKDLGADVSVLTAMPNYPKMEILEGYKGKLYMKELVNGILVHRSWIYVKNSKSILLRLLNYFSFVFSSIFIGLIKVEKHDIIICESPPLFLGISARIICFFKGSKMVFNVSDLWPESAEKLDIIRNKFLLSISYSLERWLYSNSKIVVGQTQGIVSNIKKRFPTLRTYWLPNGIDFHAFNINASGVEFRLRLKYTESDFLLVYAGIIGHAQGLEVVLNAAEITKGNERIQYLIIGDGPELDKLIKMKDNMNLKNISFLGNIKREQMPEAIAACDAYIVPLKKNDLFLGAIPSKLFEPLAMGKPIILGVDGEARELFIEKGNAGVFFEPENHVDLSNVINRLSEDKNICTKLGENGSEYIRINFDRKEIAKQFYNELKGI
jgi:glycosyltransferase involved in cell wall biosynthesis